MLSISSARKTLNLVPTLLKAGYATAVTKTSNGVRVATLDESSPAASVSLVINAGARYEPKDKAGIAHFVKNFGFKVAIMFNATFFSSLRDVSDMRNGESSQSCTGIHRELAALYSWIGQTHIRKKLGIGLTTNVLFILTALRYRQQLRLATGKYSLWTKRVDDKQSSATLTNSITRTRQH